MNRQLKTVWSMQAVSRTAIGSAMHLLVLMAVGSGAVADAPDYEVPGG